MSSIIAQQSCLKNLQSYLQSTIAGMTVFTEWPYENQKLIYPVVTLFSGEITYTNQMVEQDTVTTVPDIDGKVTATEVIGELDFKIQMDLWTANKVQRDQMMSQLIDALNPISSSAQGDGGQTGLRLQLVDYFSSWADFTVDKQKYVDDEAAAQRQERRARIDILVNCRAIRDRSYYAMTNIETYVGTVDVEDNTSETDVSEV